MKIKFLRFLFSFVLGLFLSACQKKQEPNKIIEGIPINAVETVLPAQAAAEWLLLKQDCLNIVVTVINRLNLKNQTYPELSGPDSQSRYSFSTSEGHYGTALFVIQFLDNANVVIDPISNQSSTTTLKTVTITTSGSSKDFSYSENLAITLELAGNTASNQFLSGTSNFSGSSNSLLFTFTSPGSLVSFEGLIDGAVTAAGTGPGGSSTSISLTFASDHDGDGYIGWEGQSGRLHLSHTGQGYVVTDSEKILVE